MRDATLYFVMAASNALLDVNLVTSNAFVIRLHLLKCWKWSSRCPNTCYEYRLLSSGCCTPIQNYRQDIVDWRDPGPRVLMYKCNQAASTPTQPSANQPTIEVWANNFKGAESNSWVVNHQLTALTPRCEAKEATLRFSCHCLLPFILHNSFCLSEIGIILTKK